MLYRVKTRLVKKLFDAKIADVKRSLPIEYQPHGCVILSMVSHADLSMYLLAIKSFYGQLGFGKIVIIDDGSLQKADKTVLHHHLVSPEIIERKQIALGRLPGNNCWDRLACALDLSARSFLVQLDSDTLTLGSIDTVRASIAENRSFILGTRGCPNFVSVEQATAIARAIPSNEIQVELERQLICLPGAQNFRYVRGSAGFFGLAHGAISRDSAEQLFGQFVGLCGSRVHEWGSEQAACNFLVANSPSSRVLPYPLYAAFDLGLDVSQSVFLHFFGTFRFKNGEYVRLAQRFLGRTHLGNRAFHE